MGNIRDWHTGRPPTGTNLGAIGLCLSGMREGTVSTTFQTVATVQAMSKHMGDNIITIMEIISSHSVVP